MPCQPSRLLTLAAKPSQLRYAMAYLSKKKQPPQVAAFSLLELIIVLILVGVLAAVAVPRFGQQSDIVLRTARDDLLLALRDAQQKAMADGRTIRFVSTSNSISITADGTPLPLPQLDGNYPRPLPNGVSLAPAVTLNYDRLGNTAATTFTLTGAGTLYVCVRVTGYAHASAAPC